MTDTDPRMVEQTLRISARPETVWRFWTDPDRMREWWGAASLDPRPGGACTVEMDGGPVMRGEYVELVPHERIVFTFGWEATMGAPGVAPGSTRVEITLAADGADTILTLRHTGLPGPHAEEHRAGWAHFLPRLASAAAARASAGSAVAGAMKPVVVDVDVDRPAAEVFDFLEDVTNNTRWLKGMRSCTWTTGPPVRVGSRYEQVARFLGKEIRTSFEVTAHEPGRLVTIESRDGSSFPITVTRRVEARGADRARVTETVEGDPRGFYRVAVPLLRLMVARNVRRDYGRLKTLLERA